MEKIYTYKKGDIFSSLDMLQLKLSISKPIEFNNLTKLEEEFSELLGTPVMRKVVQKDFKITIKVEEI